MNYPRYKELKESNIQWFGRIPSHWSISKIKYSCICLDGGRIPLNSSERADKQGDIPYWGANSIVDYVDEALFDEDLILLGEDGAPFFDFSKPVAFFSEGKVWPNNHVHILRPANEISGKFITHALNVTDYMHFINGSTRDKLTQSAMNEIPLPLPSFDEMEVIVKFLDQETAKIDELSKAFEGLIETLKEKRQAVISHAVTKGLDPSVPMKDSGIEWLGKVPEHWGVLKGSMLGTLFGSEQVPEDAVSEEGDLPFIKVGSMSSDTFSIESWDWFVDRTVANSYKPRSGYIVFPKRGAAIFLNKVNIVDIPSLIDPNLMGWEMNARVVPKFIAYTLKSRKLDVLADVSTVPQINNKHIAPERFQVPPYEEQEKIVAYIDAEIAKIDRLTADAARAVELLQERRTALISAAVTGKIDVRGLVNMNKEEKIREAA